MTGFEPRASGVGIDCSVNGATTITQTTLCSCIGELSIAQLT